MQKYTIRKLNKMDDEDLQSILINNSRYRHKRKLFPGECKITFMKYKGEYIKCYKYLKAKNTVFTKKIFNKYLEKLNEIDRCIILEHTNYLEKYSVKYLIKITKNFSDNKSIYNFVKHCTKSPVITNVYINKIEDQHFLTLAGLEWEGLTSETLNTQIKRLDSFYLFNALKHWKGITKETKLECLHKLPTYQQLQFLKDINE